MKTRLFYFLSFLLLSFLLFINMSCKEEIITVPDATSDQQIEPIDNEENTLSKYFDDQHLSVVLAADTPKDYMIFLGRVLFYDKNLSSDRSVSCASCHQQQYGFADNVPFSKGANGNVTDRNSIGLASIAVTAPLFRTLSFGTVITDSLIHEALNSDSFSIHNSIVKWSTNEASLLPSVNTSLFWDERVNILEEQMLETFTNPKEMDMELSEIPHRVEELPYAEILHKRAFDGAPITNGNIIASISAFINQIGSADSPFDVGLATTPLNSTPTTSPIPDAAEEPSPLNTYFSSFSAEENNGKRLFLENCSSCHGFVLEDAFKDRYMLNPDLKTATSIGLDTVYTDKGIGSHTNRLEDNGVFRIPGLRNVALTAPYMHDGRFATLEEVIDFYSTDIQPHPNLDPLLKFSNGVPIKMDFNDRDKADLVAFLNTLTSVSLAEDGNLSDPF